MSAGYNYPLRHISIRVPWHDSGWTGCVCADPKHNTACLKLINIASGKREAEEQALAGHSLQQLDPSRFPPCVKERATFMAKFALERLHEHPYANTSRETHAHFRPTPLHYPAYGAAALPFRWFMKSVVFGDKKKHTPGLIDEFPLDNVDESFEPELPFKTSWVQDHRNHRQLLECFWSHVRIGESLVFFYAKQVPLVEDTGQRVLLGAGRVLKLGPLTEYVYDGSPTGKIRSLLWEKMVTHSIRPGFADGFLLPYQEALAKSDEGRAFDPADAVAFAPQDRFTEFSFATEHVGHDAAIEALLACRAALVRATDHFAFDARSSEHWIDQQLGRLWKKRGAFPGMGAVLHASGVPLGNFVAQALVDKVGEDGNPWDAWRNAVAKPEQVLPGDLARGIDTTVAKAWQRISTARRHFVELLSRIDLTAEQADALITSETRTENGIDLDDGSFLKNPYLLYEATRLTTTPVAIGAVDRGVFPTDHVRRLHPLPPATEVKTSVDARRLRALVIRELEGGADNGDTLRAQSQIVLALRNRTAGGEDDGQQRTNVTSDLLAVAEDTFPGEVRCVEMADGARAYQLERLGAAGERIRTTTTKRIGADRLAVKADWRQALDTQLGTLPPRGDERQKEERAREEKVAALNELSQSRFNVLIGPAGTGKTTLLSVLCQQTSVRDGGILMLAPTGKARVRMEDVAKRAGIKNLKAQTLAQFLSASDPPRYDAATQRYLMTGEAGERAPRTVIVDECSMLTEEMMAALLESLSGVHRLILVGDPRQLPPIGAGRPFVDVIARLQPVDIESRFPRVGAGYAELTIPRRQVAAASGAERHDLQLAAWFGGSALAPGEDEVFEILTGERESETVQFVRWDTPEELERLVPETLQATLGFKSGEAEWQTFACSLGGQMSGDYVYFNRGRSGACVDDWQILSPVRQRPWGVETLNRLLHVRFKARQLEVARANVKPWERRLPKPFGDDQIVYGDKVINLRNQSVRGKRIYPPTDDGYLANGEIGIVVGQLRTKKFNYEPKTLEVEFSTQLGSAFTFYRPKGDDDNFSLELAYALTIHKAQGSEFRIVFLILPRSTLMLTRELLYTALTRQKNKIVVLHQGSATDLQRLSSERYSATATRLTNLFGPPKPVQIGDRFLEERLIHRTLDGKAVRSKSEVIIANLLHQKKIHYEYERPLELAGVTKYPDFTIEDDDAGRTYYWEHCGLLHDPEYRRRWNAKREWYMANGVQPIEDGGGPMGALIVTKDQPDGGIDSPQLAGLISRIFKV